MRACVMMMVTCTLLLGLLACSDDGGAAPDSGSPPVDTQLPPGDSGPAAPDGSDLGHADSIVPAGDCTDPGKTCFAPFVCRVNPKTGTKACLSPVGDIPPCVGTPPGQVVPFATTSSSNLVVHWPMKPGCVATSYAPALQALASDIAAAVKAWHDVSCSALCLDPPQEMANSPDVERRERRVHFRHGTLSSSIPAMTQVSYEEDTGRMFAVEVVIDPQLQGSVTPSGVAQLVGFAVGLMQAPATADSVMKISSQLTAPGADDTTALCKLYATPGYCAD